MKLSVVFILALVTAIIALGVLFILAALGGFRSSSGELLVSAVAMAIPFLAMCVCCAIALEQHKLKWWMRSGIYAAGMAFFGWVIYLWYFESYSGVEYPLEKIIIWPSVWAGTMALLGLLALPKPPRKWWRSLRNSTFLFVCLLAAYVALAMTLYPRYSASNDYNMVLYMQRYEFEKLVFNMGSVLGLIAITGLSATFLTLLLIPKRAGQIDAPRAYWLTCPRCAKEQSLQTGWDRCPNCGLEVCVEMQVD